MLPICIIMIKGIERNFIMGWFHRNIDGFIAGVEALNSVESGVDEA
jgi:hypothetical protein